MNLAGYRADFPLLDGKTRGDTPIYFDNACTTLRPVQVVEAMNEYYFDHPSCHRRAAHALGRKTSERYESSREAIRKFINAAEAEEIIFTRNVTEGINLIAATFPFRDGDVVLTTDMEHNSNLVPWMRLCRNRKIIHKKIPIARDKGIDLDRFQEALRSGVRLVSIFANSHVTGIASPLEDIVRISHEHGAKVLVDAAQTPLHRRIDVRKIGADFLVLSFHKMLGPSGMGALYGKREHLEALPSFLVGGETVEDVDARSFVESAIPYKFEAGLQNCAGAMGAKAAIEYLDRVGFDHIQKNELELNCSISRELQRMDKVRLIGPSDPALRGPIVNFTVEGLDSGELSILLDKTAGIMTRSGVHCAHSWYHAHQLSPSLRVSLAFYNTQKEADVFVRTMRDIIEYF